MIREEDLKLLEEHGNLIGYCYYDLFPNQIGKSRPVLLIPEEGQFAGSRCLAIPLTTSQRKFSEYIHLPVVSWEQAGLVEEDQLVFPLKRKLGTTMVYSLRHDSRRITTKGDFLLPEDMERPDIVKAIQELKLNIRLGYFQLHRR